MHRIAPLLGTPPDATSELFVDTLGKLLAGFQVAA
jgi:hypothetical protein